MVTDLYSKEELKIFLLKYKINLNGYMILFLIFYVF